MIEIEADGIGFTFRPELGLLEQFTVRDGDTDISPLHKAPWVDTDEVMPDDAAPHMVRLGGDFFCAPFAAVEDGSPLHGWPPNSAWHVRQAVDGVLEAELGRRVHGASVIKRLRIRDGHPFVYQSHVFTGGEGAVTFANHANVSVRNGALIRTSPKSHWETPKTPQESDPARGRSNLLSPARSDDPTRFPGRVGPVDLTRFPWAARHEDFVVGVESTGHALGWTAVMRPVEGDAFLSLRDPRRIPMTMLWHSNGGRDYPPWSGRHVGCLGVEEGAANTMLGLSSEDALTGPGALALGGKEEVRHVIGAISWPFDETISRIELEGDTLIIMGDAVARRTVPIDSEFLDVGEAD